MTTVKEADKATYINNNKNEIENAIQIVVILPPSDTQSSSSPCRKKIKLNSFELLQSHKPATAVVSTSSLDVSRRIRSILQKENIINANDRIEILHNGEFRDLDEYCRTNDCLLSYLLPKKQHPSIQSQAPRIFLRTAEHTHRTTESDEPQSLLQITGRFLPFQDAPYYSIAGKRICIHEWRNQQHSTHTTGINVWDGALLLCQWLEANPSVAENQFLLELGAGTGMAGIAGAVLGARGVLLTDLPQLKSLIESNIRSNYHHFQDGASVTFAECNWYDFESKVNPLVASSPLVNFPCTVILVADCVWLSSLVCPLFCTLRYFLQLHPSAVVYISYQRRGQDTHEIFCRELYSSFANVRIVDTSSISSIPRGIPLVLFKCTNCKSLF